MITEFKEVISMITWLVTIMSHIFVVLGIWKTIEPLMEPVVREIHKSASSKRRGNKANRKKKSVNWVQLNLLEHLDQYLLIVDKRYEPGVSLYRFIGLTITLFISLLLLLNITFANIPNKFESNELFGIEIKKDKTVDTEEEKGFYRWEIPTTAATIISLIPYILLRLRAVKRKREASYELKELLNNLLYALEQSQGKLEVALSNAAASMPNDYVLKIPTYSLADKLSNYDSEDEMIQACNSFSKLIGTSFAREFSKELSHSKKTGYDIRKPISSIITKMEMQERTINNTQSSARDAILSGTIIPLIVFVITVVPMAFALRPSNYFRLQFLTKTGLLFLILFIISWILSFILSRALSRPPLDY